MSVIDFTKKFCDNKKINFEFFPSRETFGNIALACQRSTIRMRLKFERVKIF